jgi:outer membrane protein OmpA-like peptidoglycan-associated protein
MKRLLVAVAALPLLALSAAAAEGSGGNWQVPKEFQVPRDTWQVPGAFQVPKGIDAVKEVEGDACFRRIAVVGDALFDFDSADLRPDATETLEAALPLIAASGTGKGTVTIVGHTDSKGSDDYNDRLSLARAETVRAWLIDRGAVPESTGIDGRGERQPVAPNEKADGSDDPEGRQKNRRVEIEIDACS